MFHGRLAVVLIKNPGHSTVTPFWMSELLFFLPVQDNSWTFIDIVNLKIDLHKIQYEHDKVNRIASHILDFFFFLYGEFYFILFYFKSLILTCVPKHEPPSHLPPHNISLGHPHAPAPSMLYPASDIDWREFYFITH